ncbi:vacuolar lysine transporter YPQ1-like [Rutidosis leptorrhynchoides]|uniref:vacuolar lysine transporter YPQ1-like n=1 Tax=Rutidosis leptorrhynchoides TaxID=125765 RepID=UPI003A99A1B6
MRKENTKIKIKKKRRKEEKKAKPVNPVTGEVWDHPGGLNHPHVHLSQLHNPPPTAAQEETRPNPMAWAQAAGCILLHATHTQNKNRHEVLDSPSELSSMTVTYYGSLGGIYATPTNAIVMLRSHLPLYPRPASDNNDNRSTNSLSYYCVKENKACIGWWVNKYFKDCHCNVNDQVSFGLGIISLVCWGVAEIPQIITNFRTKSSHGVSLTFLLTWIAGDIFNLVGCVLEPATLPTQYYTALLYTISTIILVLQSLYYDHSYALLKSPIFGSSKGPEVDEANKPLQATIENPRSSAIRASPAQRRDYYFTSARSLAGSSTPPNSNYLWTTRSGPASAMAAENDDSSEDESFVEIPKTAAQPRPIPRSVGYGTFLATSLNLPSHAKGLVPHVYIKLLQDNNGSHNVYGQWLGWLMACIYMGGRIPQIVLNIKIGSIEGLNPLMFVFALVANATYVGSILVRSTEWEKIKSNMPWLLDAAVCVALDAFIIMQYLYYKYFKKPDPNSDDEYKSNY